LPGQHTTNALRKSLPTAFESNIAKIADVIIDKAVYEDNSPLGALQAHDKNRNTARPKLI
jgi:hypothetical protein